MHIADLIIIAAVIAVSNCGKIINVHNAKEFNNALLEVTAGDTIQLSDGTFRGKFIAEKSGSKGNPITLKGSKNSIIQGYSYGFHLKASYWVLNGFTIDESLKGIVLDGANHNVLEDLHVHNIKQEAIHFRQSSSDNILQRSEIYKTGLTSPGFGEGVYIGSAVSNWNGGPDKSDRNQILNNKIGPFVAAESIDIKEGTCCGIIKGNKFDGTGMSGENYADSWIDIKGDKYVIEDNEGNHSLLDGIQIHHVKNANVGGCNNIIRRMKCLGLPDKGQCVANTIKNETIHTHGDCKNTIE